MENLDQVDRDILAALLGDGRMTYQELGREVRLSPNAVAERVRRLRNTGVLIGYRAELDLTRLGRTLIALSDVRLREGTLDSEFQRGLRRVPQILAAVHTTGEYDYQLRIACADTADLEAVVEVLKRDHQVREVRSRIVLREVDLGPGRLLRAGN